MSALTPIPQSCVAPGNITPAMREWMMNVLIDAIGFDNAITALQAARAPKNLLVNGGFDIWQRGTTFTVGAVSNVHTADRWDGSRFGVAGLTVSQQTATPPTGFTKYIRLLRAAANSSVSLLVLCQNLETVDSAFLAGQTVTLSGYMRAGAGFSAAGKLGQLVLQSGTGTDQNGCVAYTGALSANATLALTTSWQRFSVTYAVPATATELCVFADYTPVGTAPANDYMDVAGLQLEIGSQPTAFEFRPFGEQLMRCKRYYQKSFPYPTTPATGATGTGSTLYMTFRAGVLNSLGTERFHVQMRVNPTMTYFNPINANANWRNTTLGTDSAAAATLSASTNFLAITNPQVAADAVGNVMSLHWTAEAEI